MDTLARYPPMAVGLVLLLITVVPLAQGDTSATITAKPAYLGVKGESYDWATVTYESGNPSPSDWIAVFSPASFNGSLCLEDLNGTAHKKLHEPYICSAPVKFQYANFSNDDYVTTGKGSIRLRLINRREDYSFGLYTGGFDNPVLVAVSNKVQFANPKAPVWPRLAVGKQWDEMTVTWTSGYSAAEARPIVWWKSEEDSDWKVTVAVTITYTRSDLCGPPATTVGYRAPGYFHTAFLKDLSPSSRYYYKVGHKIGKKYIFGEEVNQFLSAPYPGEDSVQRIAIFGDMGKLDRDGSLVYNNGDPGALNVTDALVRDINNIDLIIHDGDITYADGYLSEWDQFVEQISNITKRVPYMISAGNHERDWPNSGSFYKPVDSGGECGVPTSKTFNMPAVNKDKLWYSFDWGMFHFCIGASEMDWRVGSEQYRFLEECFASVDRQQQPWLVFVAHRILGYSSASDYQALGTFAEPMARENLQPLWQKYKVDLSIYGHVHGYERTCPVYQSNCVGDETSNYTGTFNGTIHLTVGTGGRELEDFGTLNTTWSLVKDSSHYGYLLLTASDHQNLLVEFKATDGTVADSFKINRKYMDVLGCDASLAPICPDTTSADL
ncbi:hypothetical protein R1sor_013981 [Riccia sorocarpa]|uniref:Purple acid phosphatase n=1 Tax=Riccia sorocarpa TaxID=122646 RepID=A0ABD3HB44_9MARC